MFHLKRARPFALVSTVVASATVVGGCVSDSSGPEMLTVAAEHYAQAFDAAMEVARHAGMPATLRDRRAGVIETEAHVAGSVLEPWRTDNATLDQAVENTLAYQRRRARFEFMPSPLAGSTSASDTPATGPLAGPDLINTAQQPTDLTEMSGDLELRVWVFIERADVPGMRRSTWTRSKTTQSLLVYPEGMKERQKGTVINWVPVARDPDYEQRLLRQVQEKVRAEPAAARANEQGQVEPSKSALR
jgi:hypothetical protein